MLKENSLFFTTNHGLQTHEAVLSKMAKKARFLKFRFKIFFFSQRGGIIFQEPNYLAQQAR